MFKRITLFILVLTVGFSVGLVFMTPSVFAATPARCKVTTPLSSQTNWADCGTIGITIPGVTFEQDKCYAVIVAAEASASETSCGAAQCQQNTLLGSTPASDCPDYSGITGMPPIVPGHCYITTLGQDGVSAEEKSCLGPPFAENWTTAACRDGSFQGGSNTDAEELCKDHGGAGAAKYVICVDGTSHIVDKVLEHQDGHEDRLCEDHGGTKAAADAAAAALFTGPAGPSVGALPLPSTGGDKVQAVMSFVFALAGAVALLMVALGGFKYTTSHGEPQAIAKAKNTIMYALIGLVVVVLANFGVAYLINAIS